MCDLWVDILVFFKKLKQRNCKHNYVFVGRENYDPKSGECMNKRICRKCGKIDYKYSKIMKNYGIPNRRKHKWDQNI